MENTEPNNTLSTRELLIQSGLEELNEFGIQNFSTRRVAKRSGVSCAAPYKHFKDTSEFISEILVYINTLYHQRQKKTLEKFANSSYREQLVEISLDYICFLAEYPVFRTVIMQSYKDCAEEHRALRGQISSMTYKVVSRYCKEVNMPPDVRVRKTFIVRSIIYGAALFFDNGELQYSDEHLQMIRSLLEPEFDLP